jgi:hypothetical protein
MAGCTWAQQLDSVDFDITSVIGVIQKFIEEFKIYKIALWLYFSLYIFLVFLCNPMNFYVALYVFFS